MKIAFIDHLPVGSGIIRYATKLASHLKRIDPSVNLVYYTHFNNYKNNKELFENNRDYFRTIQLKSTFPGSKLRAALNLILRRFHFATPDALKAELESIDGYDVLYFTSAHMSPYYEMKGNKFLTLHDFNWKYAFGLPNFRRETSQLLNLAVEKWLKTSTPITSSNFIKGEIERFYPLLKKQIEVIFLPNITSEVIDFSMPVKDGLDFNYILYPANLVSHKNHLNLFRALYKLKTDGRLNKMKLVLTGAGTDHFTYSTVCNEGIVLSSKDDFDVLGLGYVDNVMMDTLIRNATLNISASLYEAASGPAIDAWISKVPFIMSDIPCHREQVAFFNLECIFFDPFDSNDIADKIDYALNNLNYMKELSVRGHDALRTYNWNVAAKRYLDVFKNEIK